MCHCHVVKCSRLCLKNLTEAVKLQTSSSLKVCIRFTLDSYVSSVYIGSSSSCAFFLIRMSLTLWTICVEVAVKLSLCRSVDVFPPGFLFTSHLRAFDCCVNCYLKKEKKSFNVYYSKYVTQTIGLMWIIFVLFVSQIRMTCVVCC